MWNVSGKNRIANYYSRWFVRDNAVNYPVPSDRLMEEVYDVQKNLQFAIILFGHKQVLFYQVY